jgi:ribosomal protein L10
MAVTRARKTEQVEMLAADLKKVSSLVVTTYTKMTVAQDLSFARRCAAPARSMP